MTTKYKIQRQVPWRGARQVHSREYLPMPFTLRAAMRRLLGWAASLTGAMPGEFSPAELRPDFI